MDYHSPSRSPRYTQACHVASNKSSRKASLSMIVLTEEKETRTDPKARQSTSKTYSSDDRGFCSSSQVCHLGPPYPPRVWTVHSPPLISARLVPLKISRSRSVKRSKSPGQWDTSPISSYTHFLLLSAMNGRVIYRMQSASMLPPRQLHSSQAPTRRSKQV